jgi:hypothetical protein
MWISVDIGRVLLLERHNPRDPRSRDLRRSLSQPMAIAIEIAQKAIIPPMKSRSMVCLRYYIFMSSILGKDP